MSSNQEADLENYSKTLENGRDSIVLPIKSYEKAAGVYNYYFKVRNYTERRYDLIMASGSQFDEAANKVKKGKNLRVFFKLITKGVSITT